MKQMTAELELEPYRIGKYTKYTFCRFCGATNLKPVINLGDMPLAGGFFSANTPDSVLKNEEFFPLEICFCKKCFLLQTNAVIAPDTLFKNYFYHTSAITTLVQHFVKLAKALPVLLPVKKSFIAEIGCNDGAFLSAVQSEGYTCIGIDPAHNIVSTAQKKGLPIIEAYFSETVAQEIVKKHGQADAIFSFNTLAHIEDMHEVIKGIKVLLKPAGFLQFEVHYVKSILEEQQYDMIYHEHQYYYSILTLQKLFLQHGMTIFNVEAVPTHAGSIRVSVQNTETGTQRINNSVALYINDEMENKYHTITPYKKCNSKIKKTRKKLLSLLKKLKRQGKKIVGYGASGRGTIISNYCGLTSDYLEYVIDDAPAKIGVITPGVHLTVHNSSVLSSAAKPDYLLLFAWPFVEEIKKKNQKFLAAGGKIILPLPKVSIQ